jgi:hypothetical protein
MDLSNSLGVWTGFISEQGQVVGCCEYGNETLVSVKFEEFFDWLRNYSATWNDVVAGLSISRAELQLHWLRFKLVFFSPSIEIFILLSEGLYL